MTPDTPPDPTLLIELALTRMADCPGFEGAVLATTDGLVLACKGSLRGDAAAACAAALSVEVRKAMETLEQPESRELLVWSGERVWYQTVLPSSHLLLAASRDPLHAGALRLAIRREWAPLALALGELSGPAHTAVS